MADHADSYEWRETWFIFFDARKRPKLEDVRALVRKLRGHFQVDDGEADGEGRIESLMIHAPQDYAALELDYLEGDEVLEAGVAMASELKSGEEVEREKLKRLTKLNARFDLMHFEAQPEDDPNDPDEMFDPSALLTVFEALTRLTEGIGVDPAAGVLY
jgi:hypothetical protein